MGLRAVLFGLQTILGLSRKGFFIPYRYAATVHPTAYPALEPIFAAAEPTMRDLLAAMATHGPALRAIDGSDGLARWTQDWFPRLDAAAAYVLVRGMAPSRIVEIGSGHSTRFMARAVADAGLPTTITCIDPAPRAAIARLGVSHVARVLSAEDLPLLSGLQSRDILFVDSSHVAMPGTDVDRIVLDVLPRLAAGTVVHIHDILLPDAYPAEWEWRGYNEQSLVGALLGGGGWEILFASHYAATRLRARVDEVLGDLPLPAGAHETSLWLRKSAQAPRL